MKRQYIGFLVVGSIGFILDSGFFFFLKNHLGLTSAKTLSFLSASYFTWFLNRKYTFKEIDKKKSLIVEYIKYLSGQIIGAVTNIISFQILISNINFLKQNLLIPLALASIIAMFLNFVIMKVWVFKTS